MFKTIKIFCIVCDKYREFQNPKISDIFETTLGYSIVCSNYDHKPKKYLKIKNQLKH